MEHEERGREAEGEEAGSPERHEEKTQRLVHFSSGETMWECSSEEEEELLVQRLDPATLPWMPFMWFWLNHFAHRSLFVCDFLGEKLANLLGLTTSKYQYAVDEYFSAQDKVACTSNIQPHEYRLHCTLCREGAITRLSMECINSSVPSDQQGV